MLAKYKKQTEPVIEYNKRIIENWERIQMDQLNADYQDMQSEIEAIKEQEKASTNFYEKIDIRKKISEKTKALEKLQSAFHQKGTEFKIEGEKEIAEFNKRFDISPVLVINIVLKF
jgi:predicted RNase H-like nuclease (RuvC/YqgF family)